MQLIKLIRRMIVAAVAMTAVLGAGAAGLLTALLWALYRQGSRTLARAASHSASTERAIAR